MDRIKIIQQTLGELLEPIGFKFELYYGMPIGVLARNFKNAYGQDIKQRVAVHNSKFPNTLYLRLSTTACGHRQGYHMPEYVPGCKHDMIDFETEEEFIQVMQEITKNMEKYGLDFLKKISIDIVNNYLREKDYLYLYNNYDELALSFIKRENIDFQQVDIEQALDIIETQLKNNREKTFFEMVNLFLELSALYGKVLEKSFPVRWEMRDMTIRKVCYLVVTNKTKEKYFYITGNIMQYWKGYGANRKLLSFSN